MKNKFATYLCFAVITVFGMVLTSYSPLLSSISATFSLSLAQSGIVFTANFIGFVAFILFGGVLADKLGKKSILAVAAAGFAASLILFPLSSNFYVACIVMALIGGFGGIIETLISAVVSDINREKASYYVNFTQVFFCIGAVIGPVTAGLFVASGVSWGYFYFLLGGINLLLALLLIIARMPNLRNPDGISWKLFKGLVTDGRFLLICLCMFLYTGSEIGSWGWMSTFLKENMGFSIAKSSIAVGAFWASMAVSRFICGHLTFRFAERHIIIVLAVISALFVYLSGLHMNELIMWVVIIGLGFGFSSQWPLIAAFGSKDYKEASGTVFALLVGSGGLGGTVIPYFMGTIGEKVNTRVASMSPVVFFAAIAVIFFFIGRRRQKTVSVNPDYS